MQPYCLRRHNVVPLVGHDAPLNVPFLQKSRYPRTRVYMY